MKEESGDPKKSKEESKSGDSKKSEERSKSDGSKKSEEESKSDDSKKSEEESKSGDSKKSEEERNIGDFNIWGIRQKSGEEWEVFLSKAESPVPRPEYVSPQDLILDPKLYRPFGQVDTDLNSTPKVDKATRKKRKYIEDTTEEVHVEKGKASRNNKGRKKVRFENP